MSELRHPGSGHLLPVTHDRARRTLRGIDEQVRKAERAVEGHAPVKRNRYIQLTGSAKSVNCTLEASLERWRAAKAAPPTSPARPRHWSSMPITGSRASRSPSGCPNRRPAGAPDLSPSRDSIEAHLSIVVTTMTVSHYIKIHTGWSIKKFVRTARDAAP